MAHYHPKLFAVLLTCGLTLTTPFTGLAQELTDPHAGYRVTLDDANAWTSQLTSTEGVTSSLCLTKKVPRLILCLQSLHKPLPTGNPSQLAKGFIDGTAKSLGVDAPEKMVAQRFTELSGFSQRLRLPPPAELRDVWMFAGVGPEGQVQTAIAFSTPEERDSARAQVLAVIDAVRYSDDPI